MLKCVLVLKLPIEARSSPKRTNQTVSSAALLCVRILHCHLNWQLNHSKIEPIFPLESFCSRSCSHDPVPSCFVIQPKRTYTHTHTHALTQTLSPHGACGVSTVKQPVFVIAPPEGRHFFPFSPIMGSHLLPGPSSPSPSVHTHTCSLCLCVLVCACVCAC